MKSWELVREEQGLSGEWRVIRREACKGSDKLVSKFTLFNYFFWSMDMCGERNL